MSGRSGTSRNVSGLGPERVGGRYRVVIDDTGAASPRAVDTRLAQIVTSSARLYLTVIFCFFVIAGIKFALTYFLFPDAKRHTTMFAIDAAISGLLSATVAYVVLAIFRGRKRRVLWYMRRVEELNHQVRNAVQALVLQISATATQQQFISEIDVAVHRIDDALRTAFPIV